LRQGGRETRRRKWTLEEKAGYNVRKLGGRKGCCRKMGTKRIEGRESRWGGGGKDKVDVEGKGDREGGDVSYPRGPRFGREKRERVRGEKVRKSLTGGEGVEVGVETVCVQERVEGGEVRSEVGLVDGTRKKSVCLVVRGKWAVRAATVEVWKVGSGGGVVVVGG
jgi:hypothetical protein